MSPSGSSAYARSVNDRGESATWTMPSSLPVSAERPGAENLSGELTELGCGSVCCRAEIRAESGFAGSTGWLVMGRPAGGFASGVLLVVIWSSAGGLEVPW
jgi:hypothetical protein